MKQQGRRMLIGLEVDEAIEILSHGEGRVYYIDPDPIKYDKEDGAAIYDLEAYEIERTENLDYIVEELEHAEEIFAVLRKEREE